MRSADVLHRVLFSPKNEEQISEQRLIIEMPNPTAFFAEDFRNYDRSNIANLPKGF